ncbi:MAG: glycosyltransferase family 4 protein [Armatimonadota bacterium]
MQNSLPKFFGRLGIDMHVITLDLAPYYQFETHRKAYENFVDEPLVPGTVEQMDGFKLHILGHESKLGFMRPVGLEEKLRELRPDILQTMAAIGWIPLDCARLKNKIGYKLFTASHYMVVVFPLATAGLPWFHPKMVKSFLTRFVPGRWISWKTTHFYGATKDCSEVAMRFFGVQPRKVSESEIGVDTEMLRPVSSREDAVERAQFREQFGVAENEILVLYTGRLSPEKKTPLLAQAIAELRAQGEPYRVLFVGDGDDKSEVEKHDGAISTPFVNFKELGKFYRGADIGCWPTQESMSMIDAAACGLPLLVNHDVRASERYEGNALKFQLNDLEDLKAKLLEMKSSELREKLGKVGSEKIRTQFSWESKAKQRIADYTKALATNK